MKTFECDKNDIVIGIDEAGRGSLIGDVFVSGFLINDVKIKSINDSKKLKPKDREEIFNQLIQSNNFITLDTVSIEEIEEFNILNSTLNSMERIIDYMLKNLLPQKFNDKVYYVGKKKDNSRQNKNPKTITKFNKVYENFNGRIFILVDGNKKPNGWWDEVANVLTVVSGDSTYYEIASASIIAKESRDKFVIEKMHHLYPDYEWNKNFGYATKSHIDKIKKSGKTQFHRPTFIKKFTPQETQNGTLI